MVLYFAILVFYILSGDYLDGADKISIFVLYALTGVFKVWRCLYGFKKYILYFLKILLTGLKIRGTLYYRLCTCKPIIGVLSLDLRV